MLFCDINTDYADKRTYQLFYNCSFNLIRQSAARVLHAGIQLLRSSFMSVCLLITK